MARASKVGLDGFELEPARVLRMVRCVCAVASARVFPLVGLLSAVRLFFFCRALP